MAKKKADKPYESVARTITISASSRMSLNIGKNFYTVEYKEERSIPEVDGVDIEKERQILWDIVNGECDNQAEEIAKTFGK